MYRRVYRSVEGHRGLQLEWRKPIYIKSRDDDAWWVVFFFFSCHTCRRLNYLSPFFWILQSFRIPKGNIQEYFCKYDSILQKKNIFLSQFLSLTFLNLSFNFFILKIFFYSFLNFLKHFFISTYILWQKFSTNLLYRYIPEVFPL